MTPTRRSPTPSPPPPTRSPAVASYFQSYGSARTQLSLRVVPSHTSRKAYSPLRAALYLCTLFAVSILCCRCDSIPVFILAHFPPCPRMASATSAAADDAAEKLICVLGDEDTVTGFLLAGVGQRDSKGANFLVVDASALPAAVPPPLPCRSRLCVPVAHRKTAPLPCAPAPPFRDYARRDRGCLRVVSRAGRRRADHY